MSNRQVMLLIVVAAVATAAGLWLGQRQMPFGANAQPAVTAALLYPKAREIDDFDLTRADGRKFRRADLEGHWTLAFFGFTHCPDVCPTTLATLREVEASLRATPTPPPVQMLFVSVDPERDTAQVLGDYARFFSPNIVAVTGSDEVLSSLTRQFGIVYMKAPLEGGGYTVDHSSQIVLVGPDATIRGLFRPPFDVARITADLIALGRGA
jgi:protein SCO1/2